MLCKNEFYNAKFNLINHEAGYDDTFLEEIKIDVLTVDDELQFEFFTVDYRRGSKFSCFLLKRFRVFFRNAPFPVRAILNKTSGRKELKDRKKSEKRRGPLCCRLC